MQKDSFFDIIVIGAGAAGLNIAVFMNKAGFKTLLVDKTDKNIGGDCLNFGCVPSKALIHVAREIKTARSASRFGVSTSGPVDMKAVKAYIQNSQEVIRAHENADFFRNQGITIELGEARFVGKDNIKVNGKEFRGKRIVLATGAKPRQLNIPGIETAPVFTNETIFDLEHVPSRLVIVGAGPIGIELGQAFKYLGSDVTIVDKGEQFLPREDPEIAAVLVKQLQRDGITCLAGSDVKAIENGETLVIERKGEQEKILFDALLVSIGRVVDLEPLFPDAADIRSDNRGRLIVDRYLRTTNPKVLACGDVVGGLQFTHATELHAGLIIRNFFSPIKRKLNTDHFAWTTYTNPEVATFGFSQKTLEERSLAYQVQVTDFTDDDRAIIDEYRYGKLKLFLSPSGKILGGSMVAPSAGELVQELILANTEELSIESLFSKVYPYPTAARINKRAAASYMSGRLTSLSKRFLHLLYH